ncbi:MAG: choice-of-anchor tandem repeat GloVer-containing protein [Terriglobales bacterium]
MTNETIVLSKIALFNRLKSFRTNAALILTMLMLMVAVATAQTYTDLYDFDGYRGNEPMGSLAQGQDGNLYGTTLSKGYSGYGVVFKVTPDGRLKVLYNFDGPDGSNEIGGLTLGTDGKFYGTTQTGGTGLLGTFFKITRNGSLTTLYNFTYAGCSYPNASPIQGVDGNFYGICYSYLVPKIYKITPSGIFTVLGSLPGSSPNVSPLLQGTDGNFYGPSDYDGTSSRGMVFRMTPKGIVKAVYSFHGKHGNLPMGALIQGGDGNFYGTTEKGGANGGGVVYRLTPGGALTVLHNFRDPNYPNDGSQPKNGVVQATDGNLYGVTYLGGTVGCGSGTVGCGIIFQITAAGAYSILYHFDGTHGAHPWTTPIQHTNGKIYGLAWDGGTHGKGVVYSLDIASGPFVRLVSTSGKVGKNIEVLGQGFTDTTDVSFNGTPATFTVVSDTYLKATVPDGATTGFVTVTTLGGTLTSNQQLRVKP